MPSDEANFITPLYPRRLFLKGIAVTALLPTPALAKGQDAKQQAAQAIHDAAEKGDAAALQKLITDHPDLINNQINGGITPLGRAVVFSKVEIVRLLLKAGADVNLAKPDGAAPLHDAVTQRNVTLVTLLLDYNANTEAHWKLNITPLLINVWSGNAENTALLLAHGAKINARTTDGQTPLLVAVTRMASTDPKEPRDAAAALLDTLPGALQATTLPLGQALTKLLTTAGIRVAVDTSLAAPITAELKGGLGTSLGFVLRMARNAGQPVAIRIEDDGLSVRRSTVPTTAFTTYFAGAEGWPVSTPDPRRRFLRTISRPVLVQYLSRAVTHYGLCSTSPEQPTRFLEDDLRMLTDLGVKFIGRAAYAWVPPDDDEAHFKLAAERATRVHQVDREMILQACVFEAIYDKINNIPVPDWVFEEFGLPVEKRNFRYDDMRYNDGKYLNHWTQGASVPDMTKRETRMYFYYRGRRYIDAGFESIHWGQVHLMDEADPAHASWLDLLTRVRRYASRSARRRMILCDAHTHGVVTGAGKLLFDFHSWPLMAHDVKDQPQKVRLEVGYYNSIYHKSRGGVTQSGWSCSSLPYICEFDCGGVSGKPGQPSDFPWLWGYACGDWFAHQPRDYQREYLSYADSWLRSLREDAFLQMPTRLNLGVRLEDVQMWHANRRSPACTDGFNFEEEIKAVWGV